MNKRIKWDTSGACSSIYFSYCKSGSITLLLFNKFNTYILNNTPNISVLVENVFGSRMSQL